MKIMLFLLLACAAAPAGAADKAPTRNQYYAAIAYHAQSNSAGWATDRRSARDAKTDALRQCGHPHCEVVASITRGCGALAKGPTKHFIQRGATANEAQAKALRVCGPGCEVLAWTCTR